jgi:hypothetical protein
LVDGTGHDCGFDRRDFELEIEKRAEAIRAPGESRQQAFTRYATQDETGKLLFKASLKAPPRIVEQAPQDLPARPEPAGEASAELERLARFEAKSKGGTYEQNYVRLLTSPEHKELVRRARSEELHATQMAQDARWPLRNAERTSLTREWAGELDRVGRRRFRPNSQ